MLATVLPISKVAALTDSEPLLVVIAKSTTGTRLSMLKLSVATVPVPAFPATSATPVKSSTISFVASSISTVGVKVAV